MKRIGLLSDTHGYLDENIISHLEKVDEIWHAGDFGTLTVSDQLSSLAPLRGVYGNVDGNELRNIHPLHQHFVCEKLRVWMTHIGGYPGHYAPSVKTAMADHTPDLFISGHSHILKVMRDPRFPGLMHMNPGAAGVHGFHHMRTLILFQVNGKTISEVDVVELGKRGDLDARSLV